MVTRKILFTLLTLLLTVIVTAQTFVLNGSTYIGKSKKEINAIVASNNLTIQTNKKEGSMYNVVCYDSANSVTNHFFFARTGPLGLGRFKCVIYLANVDDKFQFEKIKGEVQTKCEEKISDKRFVQLVSAKKYDWIFASEKGSDLFSIAVQRHHGKRNNR